MWKSLFYKEWLKVHWFLILIALIGIVVIGYIFLALKHSFAFSGARNIWSTILFQGFQYFKIFKFVPLAGGLVFSLAQYLPEITNKRIKLSFHAPLQENKVLLIMQAFGASCLFILFLFLVVLFGLLGSVYLPVEVVSASIITILPWTLAGLSAYFLVAFIVLEPAWIFRFFYSLFGASFISMHFIQAGIESYRPVILSLFLMCILISTAVLFSGYRLRKGVS